MRHKMVLIDPIAFATLRRRVQMNRCLLTCLFTFFSTILAGSISAAADIKGGDFFLCPGSSSNSRAMGPLAFPYSIDLNVSDIDIPQSLVEMPKSIPNPVKSLIIKKEGSEVAAILSAQATVTATPYEDLWDGIKKRTLNFNTDFEGYHENPTQLNITVVQYSGDLDGDMGVPSLSFVLTSEYHSISSRLKSSYLKDACPEFGVTYQGELIPSHFEKITGERKFGKYTISMEGRIARYDVIFLGKINHVDLTQVTLDGVIDRKLKFTNKEAIQYIGGHHNFNWDIAMDLYKANDLTTAERQSLKEQGLRYLFFPSIDIDNDMCSIHVYSEKFDSRLLHSEVSSSSDCYGNSNMRFPFGI